MCDENSFNMKTAICNEVFLDSNAWRTIGDTSCYSCCQCLATVDTTDCSLARILVSPPTQQADISYGKPQHTYTRSWIHKNRKRLFTVLQRTVTHCYLRLCDWKLTVRTAQLTGVSLRLQNFKAWNLIYLTTLRNLILVHHIRLRKLCWRIFTLSILKLNINVQFCRVYLLLML